MSQYSIPGYKVMLLGESGAGKTHSLVTLIEAGITPFIIFTEPGMATLGKALNDHGLSEDQCHWRHISSATQSWGSMIKMSENLNKMSFDMITKMTDPHKMEYTQWIDVLKTCEDFVDERTGTSFGNVGSWGPDRALIIDSLSGLNDMAMALIVGSRPTRSMPDWMVAQNNLVGFINKLCVDLDCHFILTGHLEREQDEVSGGISLMASTLGKKLAPKLPRYFDEVVMAKRLQDKFMWSTAEANAALKFRLLPDRNDIPPSFVPLTEAWKAAGGRVKDVA